VKKPKKRFYIKKYRGDDKYSWAVFDERQYQPVCTGCLKREAEFHRDQLEKERGFGTAHTV
jgi:hypothetical protein